jgi:hypothetical protein
MQAPRLSTCYDDQEKTYFHRADAREARKTLEQDLVNLSLSFIEQNHV